MPVTPEVQTILDLIAAAGTPPVQLSATEMREQYAALNLIGSKAEMTSITDHTVPGPAGDVPVRVYVPTPDPGPRPVLVYFHGGGWVIGDIETHDGTVRSIAAASGVTVVSVDYRLAPEHPFPAAIDDCVAAVRWVVANAGDLDVDATRLAVGGDSAGGNLAAAVALQTTRSGDQKPVMQLLLYPAVDATRRRRSRELFGNGFLLTDHDMTWFMDQYSPVESERGDPRLSVLLADDLTELPTAYVVTSGFDPLRDEGEAYAKALSDAGVPVVARRFPDLIHGFANIRPVGHRFEEALFEIVGTVRAALDLHKV
jgi:acetyl esterase